MGPSVQSAVKSGDGPLCLFKLHAEVVVLLGMCVGAAEKQGGAASGISDGGSPQSWRGSAPPPQAHSQSRLSSFFFSIRMLY